ncbi:MAG: YdcH family protein [Rhodospirillaceae bacterium]|nr:YdcH family protein [Rhodospirillaceae bacterium]
MGHKDRIVSLEARHHELEEAINAQTARPHPNEDEIHSLKKEKLRIKDEISTLGGV